MQVRRPVLLDANLAEAARLWPVAGTQTVTLRGASEATISLPEDAPDVQIHDWISIYNAHGFSGVYRVSNVAHTYTDRMDITLLHGIDILNDSVWAAQTDFEGTVAQYLTAILNQQTHLVRGVKPWVLGTCADTSTLPKQTINYNRLSDLFWAIEEEGGGYYFTFDQTQWPWVVNYVALPSTVQSEFRLSRNVRSATVTLNDADLCTRLILSVNNNGTTIKTYNASTAQATWGIVTKTADIDTDDDVTTIPDGASAPSTPQADAWAANYLAQHSTPAVQVQIDGDDLKALTGDTWDETKRGTLCKVAFPAYNVNLNERVESITYPQLFDGTGKDPTHVTVSLANTLPKVSTSIATLRDESARTARSARGSARGVKENQAAIVLEREQRIDEDTTLSGRITVEAGKITQIVSAVGADGQVTAASIVLAINNGGSQVVIEADHLYLDADKTVTIGDAFYMNSGAIWMKRQVMIGDTSFVTVNNGTVNAPILQVNANGYLQFSPTGQYGTVIQISHDIAASLITDVQIVGPTNNEYKLQYKKIGLGTNWQDAQVSFSRATTLTGEWDSGVFTVEASPQGNTKLTSLTTGAGVWDGTTVTIPIYATIDGGATLYDTGKTATATYSGGGSHNVVIRASLSRTEPSDWRTPDDIITASAASGWLTLTATCGSSTDIYRIRIHP